MISSFFHSTASMDYGINNWDLISSFLDFHAKVFVATVAEMVEAAAKTEEMAKKELATNVNVKSELIQV
jgi:hypothetical protein